MPKPKIYFHTSYIGAGGYNNHAQNLIHEFSINYSGEVREYGNTNNGFKDVILDDHLIFGYNMNYNLNNNRK